MKLLRKILCAVFGHDYWLCASQWRCHRCDKWQSHEDSLVTVLRRHL